MKTFHGIVSARQKSTEPKSGYQFVCLAFCRWLGLIAPPPPFRTGCATKPQKLRRQLNEFT